MLRGNPKSQIQWVYQQLELIKLRIGGCHSAHYVSWMLVELRVIFCSHVPDFGLDC